MPEVQFEDENFAVPEKAPDRRSFLIKLVMNLGLAKTESQADGVLLTTAIIIFIIAGIITLRSF
jgi:hypothetical protein